MATTIVSSRRIHGSQMQALVYKLTAGAADGYVDFQPDGPHEVIGVAAVKTVGTVGSTGATYTAATNTVKVECTYGNADQLKVIVFFG